MIHGTYNAYVYHRCRCLRCKRANADYRRGLRGLAAVDHDALSDLLNELVPYGLTDDCPLAPLKQAA